MMISAREAGRQSPSPTPGVRHHQIPAEEDRLKVCSPDVAAHPVATSPDAPGQVGADSTADGPGLVNGANDPVTLPPEMVREAKLAAPLKEKTGGCFQWVGAPAGVSHFMRNLADARTLVEPLKTLAQALDAGPTNLALPLINPMTLLLAGGVLEVTHCDAEFPSLATTVMSSLAAVPPFMRGGEKVIDPDQVPLPGLQTTVPGKTGMASATPVSTVRSRSTGKTAAAVAKAIRRPTSIPRFSHQPPAVITGDRRPVFPTGARRTRENSPATLGGKQA
jgi:hypothetical protein